MAATIIDGSSIAKSVKQNLKAEIDNLASKGSRPPCLEVVLVGDDPASQVYVAHKEKACLEVGIKSHTSRLPATISQTELNDKIMSLSERDDCDGILLQLPLPSHLNSDEALDYIHPDKDVDGLLPISQGRLVCKREGLVSCTPLGCMELIRSTGTQISGKRAVVVGRSLLVGQPIAQLLLHANATVTTVHSRTQEPQSICREADILVVAAGKHHLVDATWVKPGAIVIDVGMHRIDGKLAGDVKFSEVSEVAGFLTPVPRGVGPMTIAMLLSNCLHAYKMRKGVSSN